MRYKIKTSIIFLLINFHLSHSSLETFSSILSGKETQSPQKNSFLESINKQIDVLKKEQADKKAKNSTASLLEKTEQKIHALKEKLKTTPNNEKPIIAKKITILNTQIQPLLLELQQTFLQLDAVLEKNILAHQEYRDDPDYKTIRLQKKSYYTFEDIQSIDTLIITSEKKLALCEEKKKNITLDLHNKKKSLEVLNEEYKQKKKEQEDFAHKALQLTATNSFSLAHARQEGDLLDIQENFLDIKRNFFELKSKELEHRLAFLDFQTVILQNKITILKEEYALIKKSLKVDDQYLAQQQTQLEKRRLAALNLRNHYYSQISVYNGLKDDGQKQLNLSLQQLGLQQNDLIGLDDWKKQFNSINQWIAGAKIGNILVAQNELSVYKDYIEGQIELEKNKLLEEELNVDIIHSWNKMTMHKFALDTDQEINAEVDHYEHIKNDLETGISLVLDKKIHATTAIASLNRSLSNLRSKIKDIAIQKDKLFKENSNDYAQVQGLLKNAQDHLSSQIDLLGKLLDLYNQLHYKIAIQIKKIDSVIIRLKEKSWWAQANEIKWEQIRTFLPHIHRFMQDYALLCKKFFSKETLQAENIQSSLAYYANNLLEAAHILLKIICIIFLFFFIKMTLPYAEKALIKRVQNSPLLHKYFFAALLLINFIHKNLHLLFIWLVLYIQTLWVQHGSDFFNISFYLCSIPFWLYLSSLFFMYFKEKNAAHGFVFISKEYKGRFFIPFSLFAYSSCIILFFRQAFLVAEYNSDVPTLLLALNFIFLQLALISLIDKKHALAIIPTTTPLWEWIEEHVARFYYVLLAIAVGIIILSNPYLGYGRLVIPIFLKIVFTLSCLPLFSWLYKIVRKVSLELFFTSDDEIIKERFTYSKTWHGFFVIAMLFVFLGLALLVVAKVWSYPLSFKTIGQLLRYEISIIDYDTMTGRPIPLTILSLFKTIFFVIMSIIISFIVNRFILQRIFDPGLIGLGLQNTLLTLSRYLIVLAGLLIGLNNVGLSTIIVRFFFILAALGFALKEPLSDFFCYFILLVQRPIKIGDFIMLNEEIMGVVRHITPRSVIIRKKNSTTILVPNSHFITNSITNWSYSKTFLGFNDILLTVTYEADPHFVKEIILKTLDSHMAILKNPSPVVMLSDFAENGYEFTLRGYISAEKVLDQFMIASDVRIELVKALKNNNIEIARPIRYIKKIN